MDALTIDPTTDLTTLVERTLAFSQDDPRGTRYAYVGKLAEVGVHSSDGPWLGARFTNLHVAGRTDPNTWFALGYGTRVEIVA